MMLQPANRETLGLLGRTYKDEWHADRANTSARDSALEWYQRASAIAEIVVNDFPGEIE
jgi:hypothetical protein